MRRFFYSFATVCCLIALSLFLYPILTSLPKIRDGIGAFITFGIISQLTPLAIALAVIPLCLAIAWDFATRE